MAQNISLMGADYPDVPAVQLPKTGGGMATFYDIDIEIGIFVNPGTQVQAGTCQDFSITFAHTFGAAPIVFAQSSLSSAATSNENGKVAFVMISSTTTGAVIRAFNNANIARPCDFRWVAIEGR